MFELYIRYFASRSFPNETQYSWENGQDGGLLARITDQGAVTAANLNNEGKHYLMIRWELLADCLAVLTHCGVVNAIDSQLAYERLGRALDNEARKLGLLP